MKIKNNKNSIKYWNDVKKYFENFKTSDEGIQYAIDVFYGKIKTCNYLKMACKRHILFFYKFKTEKDFPYFYDENNAKLSYAFFKEQIIPETREKYILTPYRHFSLSSLMGWKFKNDNEKLLCREFFDIEARKQGKSTFFAILCLWVSLRGFNDFEPRIFLAGPQKDSSAIIYNICNQLISNNKKMRKYFLKNNSIAIYSKQKGLIKKLAFEKSSLEGQNPTLGVLTEFHLHKNTEMQESFKSSINKSRKNQLIIYDTTKGHNLNFPCFKFEKDYKLSLKNQIDNPKILMPNADIFLLVAELDDNDWDNWDDPKLWYKANPNLGITIDLEDLKSEFEKINGSRAAEIEFKTKRLGIWVNQASAYFSISDFVESNQKTKKIYEEYFIDSEKFNDLECIVGLDLSNSQDTTSIAVVFEIPQDDNESIWIIKNKCFIPKLNSYEKEKKDRVPYYDWNLKGWLDLTDGKIIDYNKITDFLEDLTNDFNILYLAYDKWQFHFIREKILLKTNFSEDQIIEVKQNSFLTPAWKQFERKLKLNKIHFCDNEMLINHFLNISLTINGPNDLLHINKIKQTDRIDAAMATISACYLLPKNNIENTNKNFASLSW